MKSEHYLLHMIQHGLVDKAKLGVWVAYSQMMAL
jgi:hypothetical protein